MKTHSRLPMLGLVIWFIAALFFLYEFFLRTFIGTVAHQIIPALHLTAETFALIGSAYYIAYAAMQMPVGILADKFGVKINMIFATLVCAAGTFLFAHSTGFTSAFLSRILMGLGSSFAFVCLLVIAMTWFPRKYFGFFAGASQFVGTMGPLLAGGPLVLLLAASHGHWRIVLSGIGAFGIVLAILSFLLIKNKPKGGEQALIHLVRPKPLLILLKRLLKNPQAWFTAIYSGTVYVSISLMGAVWGTDYLQAKGMHQDAAATIVSLAWAGYAVGCPLLGGLSDIIKRRTIVMAGSALLGILVTIGIVYLPGHNEIIYLVLFIALGLAAAGQNVGFATIAEHVDHEVRATAMGLNNGLIMLSGAILPPIVSLFISHSHHSHAGNLQASDFTAGLSFMPVLFLIAFILAAFCIRETYCRPQKEMVKLRLSQ